VLAVEDPLDRDTAAAACGEILLVLWCHGGSYMVMDSVLVAE